MDNTKDFPKGKSDSEWQKQLSPEEYRILREKGTEAPGSGKYNLHFEQGVYHCKGCMTPLFKDASKFDAGCGWPSFDQEIEKGIIHEVTDTSHGMVRTEIVCSQCGGHLGHVFPDGPTSTGLRYCVNSQSIHFTSNK